MDNNPISVIMSMYREEPEHLKLAVESVLNQTYKDFEFIIIADDPCNKKLIDIIEDYQKKDSRIHFFVNSKNMGAAMSRNRALFMCKGKYVAIMDADDVCDISRLEDQISYFNKNKHVDVVFSGRTDIDEKGNVINPFKSRVLSENSIKEMLKYCDIITNPVVMAKTDVLKELGGMRSVECAEDYDLWLRCVSNGYKIHYINKSHLNYRIRRDSLSHGNYARTWVGTKYALKLFGQRQKTNVDSYSVEDFENFVKHSILKNKKSTKRFNDAYKVYCNALDKKNKGKTMGALLGVMHSVLIHFEILRVFVDSLLLKRCEKKQS